LKKSKNIRLKTYNTNEPQQIEDITMSGKYTDEQIKRAIDNLIDGWEIPALIHFAYHNKLDYFLHDANQEEIESLIQDFGNEE
tara:strand:+ start:209 stop:457 length:249 start_codon:yes stop_codon:yes gene_type:complete